MSNAERIANAAALIGRPNDTFHTYAKWKELGFQVQRGQKAVLQVDLWIPRKRTKKEEAEGDERTRFIVKTSHLFGAEQVAPIEEPAGVAI